MKGFNNMDKDERDTKKMSLEKSRFIIVIIESN